MPALLPAFFVASATTMTAPSPSRLHYRLMAGALALQLLLLADTYLFPARYQPVVLEHAYEHRRPRGPRIYTLVTSGNRMDVPLELFEAVSLGDTLLLDRSRFSGALRKCLVMHNGKTAFSCDEGTIATRMGIGPVCFIVGSTLLALLLYREIPTPDGRAGIPWVLFLVTVAFLGLYVWGW